MSLGVAFRAFFAALFDPKMADRLRLALQGEAEQARLPTAATAKSEVAKPASQPEPRMRSEALTLLSTLQREARLLDLVHESLEGFDDAQIGAAAREVLRDCRKSLDRMFAIAPLAEQEEGSTCPLGPEPSPAKYRLVGKSTGTSGTIAHRGWQATRCDVPQWRGRSDESLILAAIEVDVN